MHRVITFDSFIRSVTVVLGIVLVILAIDYLSAVLVPFFVAWFVAYLIFPIVEFFQYKLKLRFRALAIVAALLLIIGVVAGIVFAIAPSVTRDFHRFFEIVNLYITKGAANSTIPEFVREMTETMDIVSMFRNGQLFNIVQEVMPRMWNVVQHTAGFLISLISWAISVLYLFFLLYDYDRIAKSWQNLVPKRYRPFAEGLFLDLKKGMNAYFRGQMIIAFLVGVLFCIGFTIIDFPLAIPLGILMGVLSFIPYLHALGLIPAFLMCILKSAETGQNFWLVVLSAAMVFVVVQIIQDGLLTPKIMGDAIGLPPFLILLSLSVWGYLLGIIGMIIALPLTTIIFSYYKRFISRGETPSN